MSSPTQIIQIWDPFVRVFHWAVAILFLLNYWVLEEGDPPHKWAGYIILGLLSLRIIWGFIGPERARFTNFFPTPTRVKHHIHQLRCQQVDPCEGHNPLGGAMVIALMLMLLFTGLTGWLQTFREYRGEEWLEDLHEFAANFTLMLVIIHISAVFIMTKLTAIPLLKTMITGKRSIPTETTWVRKN